MGARNESKALAAIQEIKKELPTADIRFLGMDLTTLESVVAAARDLRRSVIFNCSLCTYYSWQLIFVF